MPATCSSSRYPVPTDVLGKSEFDLQVCKGFTLSVARWVHVIHWAVAYTPYFNPVTMACPGSSVVPFRRRNETALIYHKPAVSPTYFKQSHPGLFKAWIAEDFVRWPCHKVPVSVYKANGLSRVQFVEQVKDIRKNILEIRNRKTCDEERGAKRPRKDIVRKERVLTAALTYVESVAFNNNACL